MVFVGESNHYTSKNHNNEPFIYTSEGEGMLTTRSQPPYYIDLFWKYLMTCHHKIYEKYCNILIGRYIGRDQIQPRYSSIREKYQKRVKLVFGKSSSIGELNEHTNYITHGAESSIGKHKIEMYALLTRSQIHRVKRYIIKQARKDGYIESINLFKARSLVKNLRKDVLLENDIAFSLLEFQTNFSKFEANAKFLFNKLILIELPMSILLLAKSKLLLNSNQLHVLMIEYVKFLILKHYFPSETYCGWMISKIWSDHFTISHHYQSMCNNVFGNIYTSIREYQPSLSSSFEQLHYETIENYKYLFGGDPPDFIWKSYSDEIILGDTQFYNVNLMRMVIYHYYEQFRIHRRIQYDFEISGNPYSSKSLDNPFEEYRSDVPYYGYRTLNVSRKYILNLMVKNRNLRLKYLKNSDYNQYIWRKNYPPEFYEDITDGQSEIKIWSKGGYKFMYPNIYFSCALDIIRFTGSLYFPKFCYTHTNYSQLEGRYLANLEDLADKALEYIHLYNINSEKCKLKFNGYIVKGLIDLKNSKRKRKRSNDDLITKLSIKRSCV